ncbi:MAG: hypothetical protein KGL74_08615 [Elusimicrobia bacterium]|nr:hypothetical protein [Elusimicrobiota bacterium]MDE2511170.1 hypothetical protein [Elusimicrobiota bacterium]
MRLPLLAVTVALLAAVARAAELSPSEYATALSSAQTRARQAFLTQEPGEPLLDVAIPLPPPPSDAAPASQREKLVKAFREAREVQEGCPAPCVSDTEVASYLDKIRRSAAALGLTGSAAARAAEHYAPRRVPRPRAANGTNGTAAPAGAPSERARQAMARADVSREAHQAFGQRAARMADILNQSKASGAAGPAAVAGAGTTSPGDRARRLAEFRAAPAGDSPSARTLRTRAPPPAAPAVEPLTRMERLALWVDAKVGSDNIQKAADFSAGFGDSLSFGATRWVRKKMGTDGNVNDGNTLYNAGTLSAVAVSLVIGGGAIFKPFNAGVQQVARWAPSAATDGAAVLKEGQFVMAGAERGAGGVWNWLKAGGPELTAKYGGRYLSSATTEVPGALLRYPIAEEGRIFGVIKGLMGQRIYVGPTVSLL